MGGPEATTGIRANEPTRSLAASYAEEVEPVGAVSVMVGATIGRYQVRRLLGEGGMGRVYLARDIALGRSVALKLVGGGLRVDSFLEEARTIARLNHPNIVQLYDFGEYGPGLYLALEYIEGQTLRERARQVQLGLDEVLRHVRAVADALAHAHASGVFHCDLKPGNIMIGRDGRIRVVDFGLARTSDTHRGAAGGTPDWMAPEQWEPDPLTDRVDTWALGIVTAQLLTGAHPLGDDPDTRHCAARDPGRVASFQCDRRGVHPAVIDLVIRSLEPSPALRPSAADWARTLEDTINGRGDAYVEDGPYPGLAAFHEQHARFYFGREAEVDEFLERLRELPCLPIVGPSGTGKSSFLHAGVIPRLCARERWLVLSFRPGADPVAALARHVIAADREELGARAELVQAFRAELLETPTLLAARLATLATALRARVLLAVDQLEEAFTQCGSDVERTRFLQMLLSAADDPLDPVRVVFTVRDDFLGKIAGLRSLFVMQKLGEQNLRRTITEPLARCRYEFDDPSIVEDLIAEVGTAEVADLPLLQFACRTLWDGRDATARKLRRATYREMGGLAGALARHAERALAELSPTERRIARTVLLQLVSGTTRRTVARERLIVAGGDGAGLVLDRLISARLLVQRSQASGDRDGDGTTVEIAHESLLQTWDQLARWVDESRDERRLLDELEDAASLWERRGRRTEETWSLDDLAAARHRAAQLELALPPRIEAFLAAGEDRWRKARRRRRIRLGIALASAGSVAVVAFILTGRYLAREHLIRTNAGTVDLVFAPYDWIGGAPSPVPLDQLPGLAFRLYAARPGEPHQPGDPMPPDLVDIERVSSGGGMRRIHRVTAPGGMMFLEVTGRGRADERCAPSWIRIQSFPGYGGAARVQRFVIEVPTCQATRADMQRIDAGDFVYGGPGVPPSKMHGLQDYTWPEERRTLPTFFMDQTEVSNAAFAPFARLEQISGYPAPIYSNDPVHARDAEPAYPVSNVDAFTADAFCRYLGKQLPTDPQWVKAARGGSSINGAVNEHPLRLYPWGTAFRPECVNQDGLQDGHEWVAPVDAFACGASPYRIRNLVGNVQEWIAREDQPDRDNPHRAVRGGGADSPPELEHTTTLFINHRDPRVFNYSIGFRCVSSPEPGEGEGEGGGGI